MAPQQSLQTEIKSPERTISSDGLDGVFGAGRLKTAAGREKRRENNLIYFNDMNQKIS